MQDIISKLVEVCWQAADAIMACYDDDFNYTPKKDGSPLTKADLASHHIIVKALSALTPNIKIISEESSQLIRTKVIINPPISTSLIAGSTNLRISLEGEGVLSDLKPEQLHDELDNEFWLVDPLDGTKEFIKKNGEFTINIALVREQNPILGLVCCPAFNEIYIGHVGHVCYKQKRHSEQITLKLEPHQPEEYIVIGSRSHGNQKEMGDFLKDKKVKEFLTVGSSLKFCRIAEGKAHLYPRFGRTMEWDTAAGHAVLMSAGGEVKELDGKPLYYGKARLENPHFLASFKCAESFP
ncbi:hypothetical protein EP47_03530 [Legionella norrlandica]|uniref:3'(2'),5'-bisphosphate nucleotidase CysQ n=1 Tax=Legionella norrlandica TaxID=1498499 RepID=A0A0A2SW95_9GAMM|nr:3'(2'),5'-bisphosphate nucleotidase CysQ [Legionella norrlandica]KGP64006.1 hypothetical protein EP47_03530 [Legionella norrlandica]